MGAMAVIKIHNLTKKFGDVLAVDNVTLSIDEGQLFGLLGPNGSGKTTMIKMLTGQIKPTNGTAEILDIDVLNDPIKVRAHVGIIPEQETPPSFLTAEEYLEFVGNIRKLNNIQNVSEQWFKMLDFEDQKNALCKDLSRGTRQKLMVAQAFLHEPRIAFIDEPLINLDPIIQRTLKDFLLGYIQKGNTVFFSTHVLEIAEEICTHIGIIDKGRLLHHGPITELKKKKQHLEEFFLKLVKAG
jgi:ABC-2 type transport system ATP-binding protein